MAILGQGYVGLSLAHAAAAEGFAVVGIDSDPVRVGEPNGAELTVPGVAGELFDEGVASGRLRHELCREGAERRRDPDLRPHAAPRRHA